MVGDYLDDTSSLYVCIYIYIYMEGAGQLVSVLVRDMFSFAFYTFLAAVKCV